MIVRGVIYLIRAISGNEQFGKSVADVMDKSFESHYEATMKRKVRPASTHNVAILLGWVFLFLAIAVAVFIGYIFLTRPK